MLSRLKAMFGAKNDARISVSTVDEHNAVYKQGCDLIKGRIFLDSHFPQLSARDAASVRKGIECFQAVVAFHPANWNAHWLIGKSQQVLKNDLAAYASFKRAYELKQDNLNIPRELAEVCLKLGYGPEAVTACHTAVELAPQNAGLHANLALAYLINGEINFAKSAIQHALELDQNDQISKRVQRAILDVSQGKKTKPNTLRDLQPNT